MGGLDARETEKFRGSWAAAGIRDGAGSGSEAERSGIGERCERAEGYIRS